MATWLVSGGSGFLGINLVRFLLKRKQNVKIIDIASFDYPEKSKVKAIQGDIRDKKLVESAMKGVDVVVHTAAALPLYSSKEIFDIDVNGTKIVLDCAFQNKVKRFIHISSTAVYGIPDHHPLFEHDKLEGVGPYGEAKVLAEKECEKYREKGMCVSILRPKSFVGPERLGVFAIYFDWIRRGKNVPIVGSGENRYQLLDVEDLCEAIWCCTTMPKNRVNDVFNIGAEQFTIMKEDFGAVLKHAGHGKRIIPLPATPVIWMLRILELFKLSPLYKWIYETASMDSFVSIDKAKKKLRWKPRYSNKAALIRTYKWYLSHFKEYKGREGISHRAPWKQGVLSLVRRFF